MMTLTDRVEREMIRKGGWLTKNLFPKPNLTFPLYTRMVEKKAYELYVQRGCQKGHELEDWCEAERQVEAELMSEKTVS